MKNLDKFSSISESGLARINGGDNSDYNMGYEYGRDVRRGIEHGIDNIVRWWNHTFAIKEMSYNVQ